jgi:chemotaxis family two-component system sensor kinase Cph1
MFFVRDNGVGIQESDLDIVFAPLQRRDRENLNAHGTRLGLAQVKKIVRRHHGKIWLESTVGLGTTVWFSLLEHPG